MGFYREPVTVGFAFLLVLPTSRVFSHYNIGRVDLISMVSLLEMHVDGRTSAYQTFKI